MSKASRQKALLAVLLLALAVVLWMRWSGSEGGARRGPGGRVGALSLPLAATDVVELRLAALEAETAVYSPGRDPFSYGRAPEPTPPPPPPPSEPKKPRRQRARNAAASAGDRATPPPVDVKFLGSFGKPGDRIAVFSDGPDILNAKVGDVLKDKFIVDAIGYESADLKFVGFPDTASQRLPAGG